MKKNSLLILTSQKLEGKTWQLHSIYKNHKSKFGSKIKEQNWRKITKTQTPSQTEVVISEARVLMTQKWPQGQVSVTFHDTLKKFFRPPKWSSFSLALFFFFQGFTNYVLIKAVRVQDFTVFSQEWHCLIFFQIPTWKQNPWNTQSCFISNIMFCWNKLPIQSGPYEIFLSHASFRTGFFALEFRLMTVNVLVILWSSLSNITYFGQKSS